MFAEGKAEAQERLWSLRPFATCPVDGPHAVADDFGAPRYQGGFHKHTGNDILAPYGTPIVAPFPGVARQGAPLRRALARLSEISEVAIVSSCTGGYDVIAEVVCTDQVDLFQILHDEIRASPGVEIADGFTVLQMHKDQYRSASLAKRLAGIEV